MRVKRSRCYHTSVYSRLVAFAVILIMFPACTHALFFGGPILPLACPYGLPGACKCFNGNATYITVGLPRPGILVWTPLSRTYRSGPPLIAGQYVLGSATVPYYCVANVFPVVVLPGLHIDFLGTSGVPASAAGATSTLPLTVPTTTITIDLREYCRTRTTPPVVAENDPCAPTSAR